MGLVALLCKACSLTPCCPRDVNATKVKMGRCWRHPWISAVLVLGIIIANALIIDGSGRAADALAKVVGQIEKLSKEGISTVTVLQSDLNSVNDALTKYTTTVNTYTTELQTLGAEVKSNTLSMIQQNAYTQSAAQFNRLAQKCTDAAVDVVDPGIEESKKILAKFGASDAVTWISEKLIMMQAVLTEIKRYEEIIVAVGDVAGSSVSKMRGGCGSGATSSEVKSYISPSDVADAATSAAAGGANSNAVVAGSAAAVAGGITNAVLNNQKGSCDKNKTVTIDLSIYFEYLDQVQTGLKTMVTFVDNTVDKVKVKIPAKAAEAKAMLEYLHGNSNITKILASEYEKLFSTIEISTSNILLDVDTAVTNWQTLYAGVDEKMTLMLALFTQIRDISSEWKGKLALYLRVPGQAIGALGIFISIGVLFFSFVVRCERQDGIWKHFQLTGQNILFFTTYTLCDAFVIISFALLLLFAIIGGLQATLQLTCNMKMDVCDNIHDTLTPAVAMVCTGTILNMLMSYHLTGAMTANYTRFVGGLRHCCGNQLAHHAKHFDINQDGSQGSVSKNLGLHDESGKKVKDGFKNSLPTRNKETAVAMQKKEVSSMIV